MKSTVKNLVARALLPVALMLAPMVNAASTVIDVLVVYTQGTANLYGGDPTTRFNQVFQFTNQIYADSGVDMEIRLVKTQLVNYTDDNSAETALDAITNGTGVFSGIAALRQQHNADMVIFYRPFKQVQGSCGLAWVGGMGTNGNFTHASIKGYMYSHVAIDSCGDYVTAHELGHNMGLKHSRVQDGTGGTFSYALGYGVNNSFTTVMAYQTSFNVDYWTGKVYKFSSPDLTCKGVPCGVARTNNSTGADARHALSVVAPQIANFFVGSNTASSASSSVKSSSSSSVSSINTSDINEVKKALDAAKIASDAANAAVAANKAAITTKTKEATAAKTALTKASATAKSAKAAYDTAVKKYNASVAALTTMKKGLDTAKAAYDSATGTAKDAKAKAYNTAVTKYNAKVQQANAEASAATAAQAKLAEANQALTTATNANAAAVQALAAEKALTAGLTAQAKAALTAYNNLLKTYNTLLKNK